MRPLVLPANRPRSFYRGAGRIDAFRGTAAAGDPYHPEDWVASTTARFGAAPAGLTTLPDGRLLADAIADDPVAWLGPAHVARHGANPAILVKLLDAGERLPVHVHPDRPFATEHLASPYGKTEAWVIIDAKPDAIVHLGFSRPVEPDELARWVHEQNVADMLAATNRIPVRRGDAIVCPAGVPHAIGDGIFLVEVQEPTDFSVLLEWDSFAIDGAADGHLGLGFDLALACVDRSAWSEARLADLAGRKFATAADGFFGAEWLSPDGASELGPAFSVLIVLSGRGTLSTEEHTLPVAGGQTVLVPYGAGPGTLRGVEAVRCLPPR